MSRPASDWLHEIKHDGYRLMVHRQGPRVRLFTRQGYGLVRPLPAHHRGYAQLKTESFVIDGVAVWLDENCISHFDRLHCRKHFGEVRFVAFDLLAVNGDEIRDQPLHVRKARLAELLAKSPDGIQINEHMAARSAWRCSSTHASSGWKGSFRSIGIVPIAPDRAHIG